MRRGANEAETCALNGWTVGTRLAGDEGYGVTVIEITAIGLRSILAYTVTHKGEPVRFHEGTWTLAAREWVEVTTTERKQQ